MGQPFCQQHLVEFHQTDAAGIMHFAQYYILMEKTEHAMWRASGMSVVHSAGDHSVSWPRVACGCEFFAPVRFEDQLQAELSVLQISGKSVTYEVRFRCGQRDVARGTMTTVCCQLRAGGQLAAVEIPADQRRVLAQHTASPA